MGFTEEECRAMRSRLLAVKKPYKQFPVGTKAWVLGSEETKCGFKLRLEIYHPNLSGSNRHCQSIGKGEYEISFEDLGYAAESPAPKISPM